MMPKSLIFLSFALMLLAGCGDTSKIDKLVMSSTSRKERSTAVLTSEAAPETDTETETPTTSLPRGCLQKGF